MGRVSPRTSSRGGNNGDSLSKKSASPIHSSPLHKDLSADTPPSQAASIDGTASAVPALSSGKEAHPATTTTSGAQSQKSYAMLPPPSQPSLEGGAAGSAMTSIQEEI